MHGFLFILLVANYTTVLQTGSAQHWPQGDHCESMQVTKSMSHCSFSEDDTETRWTPSLFIHFFLNQYEVK